jgi:ribosomal protein L3 glutamine methyltransferase
MTGELQTLRDLLRWAVTRFNAANLAFGHGPPDAYDEAVFLLLHALSLPTERIEAFLDARLLPDELARLRELIERRVTERKPAAYSLNEAWLQGYKFYVDERVIVPRSFIAELLHEGLQPWVEDAEAVGSVLDLCTGSGCLAILAAEAFPRASVDAVDLSADALQVAQRNVADYGLQERVRLVQSDLCKALGKRKYDLILSNPPYVPAAAMQSLPAEYRHEPQMALAGGEDGTDFVAQLIADASKHLKRRGMLIVEVGGERAAVERRFPALPFTWLTTSGGDDMVFLLRAEDLGPR